MLITQSVLEENTARVSKKCVWALSLGLIVAISVTSLFIGLEVLSLTKQSALDTDCTQMRQNYSALLQQNVQLVGDLAISQKKNSDLTAQAESGRKYVARKAKENETITAELEAVQRELTGKNTQLGLCGVVGGLSLVGNVAETIFLMNTGPKLTAAKALSAYLQPRYFVGVLSSLESFLRRNEGFGSITFRLAYNSSVAFTRQAFQANVSNLINTVTILQTTADELLAFVMYDAWNFTEDSHRDPKAFTFSFRRYNQTTQGAGPSIYLNSEFLTIGEKEIQLKADKSAVAVANRGFNPPIKIDTPSDFYVAGGTFTLSTILVYQFS